MLLMCSGVSGLPHIVVYNVRMINAHRRILLLFYQGFSIVGEVTTLSQLYFPLQAGVTDPLLI